MTDTQSRLEREIESKFDVPTQTDKAKIILAVDDIAAKEGWHLVRCNYETLLFEYFDTPRLDAYRSKDTVRRVSGFPASSAPKAAYRYDFKVGPIERRFEKNHWDDTQYSAAQLPDAVGLPAPYTALIASAQARTNHLKMFFEQRGTLVEATHDIFDVQDGTPFCELEIELKRGDKAPWRNIAERIGSEMGLRPVHVQKYARVIEGMPRYSAMIKP